LLYHSVHPVTAIPWAIASGMIKFAWTLLSDRLRD